MQSGKSGFKNSLSLHLQSGWIYWSSSWKVFNFLVGVDPKITVIVCSQIKPIEAHHHRRCTKEEAWKKSSSATHKIAISQSSRERAEKPFYSIFRYLTWALFFFRLIDSNLAQPGTGATTSESRIGQTGKARQSDSLLVPAALSFRFITDGATTRLHMNSALFLPVYYIRWIIHSLVVDFFLRYFFFFGAPLSRSTETTHTGHVLCVSFQCHQSLTHKLKEVEKVACIVCAILHNNLVEVRWRMTDDCVNCSWRSCISTR